MTSNSRRYFQTPTEAARHLVSEGFELADAFGPFSWAHFARQIAADIRMNGTGIFIHYCRI